MISVLDQEGPMTAGRLAKRVRLSPGAMTALLDRREKRGFARRAPDTEDRRRVLVEIAPEAAAASEALYGTPEDSVEELASYSDKELEFLIRFLRGSVAYQEERMRRLEGLKAREASNT
jgi:DNA-binding MarR family transcriptional regulator